ncbi:MAG: type II toxin-antitoxin system VapC family toxin [Methanobacteriaceae archaeon]|jgi:predicted nucleic acid-binding protein
MKLFIDTSIFVDTLRTKQVESSKSLFKSLQERDKGFTSVITVAELSVGAYRSPRRDALEKTLKLLSIVNVVDLSRETAVEGGRIYAELIKKGEEIELNDCLIAATSLLLGIHEIVTRDLDHFNRIENIRAITPEELGF